MNFRFLRSKKVAAMQQKVQERAATNGKASMALRLSLLWRPFHVLFWTGILTTVDVATTFTPAPTRTPDEIEAEEHARVRCFDPP
jgi:hypothetical protein